MNIAEWLEAAAGRWPDSPALLDGDRTVATYSEFAARAATIGASLSRRYAVNRGDRVALFMTNCTEYLECLYGALWIGAVIVPINAKLHPREAAWIVEDSGAKIIFCTEEGADLFRQATDSLTTTAIAVGSDKYVALRSGDGAARPEACSDADLAWIFYTSGTTGRPKGAMLSHGNLVAMSLCYAIDVDQPCIEDGALYAAPISHGAGLYNFVHTRVGARHVIPASRAFDSSEILDLAGTLGNLSMFAAPTMIKRLVETAKTRGSNGDGLKTIVYGGAPMYLADIEDALATLGQRFVQIYGQGETPMTISALPRHLHVVEPDDRRHLTSVGYAQSCVSIRIADSDGRELPFGETGEIIVSGATVMLGYWRNPEATAQAVVDGWLRTGDVGRMDPDGLLWLSDRAKDVIISGGSNIYPREVEDVLLQHPGVREVAAVGLPDAEWGEILVACICPQDGVTVDDEELDAFCLERIARFKRPKRYVYFRHLPKNSYGKILKRELKDLLEDTRLQRRGRRVAQEPGATRKP